MGQLLNEIFEGLKEIVLFSEDVEAQEKALKMLLKVHLETSGIIEIDNFRIPKAVYQDAIAHMKNGEKISCIKVLRNGILRNNEVLGLKEAKLLSERISIIEKIPMSKGYEV